jgi:hypothetical protein
MASWWLADYSCIAYKRFTSASSDGVVVLTFCFALASVRCREHVGVYVVGSARL